MGGGGNPGDWGDICPPTYYVKKDPVIRYREQDEKCANAALHAFSRHLWSLVEELVGLCLFDINVKNDTKGKIAMKLLSLDHKVCTKR